MVTIKRARRPARAFSQHCIARIFGLGVEHVNPIFLAPTPRSAAPAARIASAAARG